ncbi:16S rRNA (guanine(966)-N(2))-methyltransferase RsmD [bacterium]|nr:16S rRNA (guanine(966)-N(2))-methyltransferase RsmD [bacterium]
MNITGGKYNSLIVHTAEFTNIKPTLSKIRQAVFNTISSMLEKKDKYLFCDLFAGSGIMTFEAISRGFETISVEINKKSTKIIKENATKLQIPINIINTDSVKFLEKTELKFDVIYIDPPYQSGLYEKVLTVIDKKNILNEQGIIVIEKPDKLELSIKSFSIIKNKKYSDKSILYLIK